MKQASKGTEEKSPRNFDARWSEISTHRETVASTFTPGTGRQPVGTVVVLMENIIAIEVKAHGVVHDPSAVPDRQIADEIDWRPELLGESVAVKVEIPAIGFR